MVKNTLAKLGIKDTEAAALEPYFEGPTAIAISRETENMPAKVLAKFAEEHELPKFKAGFVDGNVIDAKGVLALSKAAVPARSCSPSCWAVCRARRATSLGVMEGPLRNLVSVLKQASEKAVVDVRQVPREVPRQQPSVKE